MPHSCSARSMKACVTRCCCSPDRASRRKLEVRVHGYESESKLQMYLTPQSCLARSTKACVERRCSGSRFDKRK